MPTSLVKFSTKTNSQDGKKLFWDRSEIDGLPFRGPTAPLMPDEEFEARTVRVADGRNGFFDTMKPAENKLYLEIIDACFNGWFQCLFIERFWNGTTKHYVEWVEYYLEDGTRSPFSYNQGNPHGQGNVAFDPQHGPQAGF